MATNRTSRATIVRRRPAGPDHEVVSVARTEPGVFRHCTQVCAECPWRTDRPAGVFPAEAFRHSAPTAYDQAVTTFACHMSDIAAPATCAGFLLRNATHNVAVRIAQMTERLDLEAVRETAPLYEDYRAMAVANGVPADDPVLEPCRGPNN